MQATDVGGFSSDPRVVLCGVPQPSILGPLLLLVYVNDGCLLQTNIYADDSALLVSGKHMKTI